MVAITAMKVLPTVFTIFLLIISSSNTHGAAGKNPPQTGSSYLNIMTQLSSGIPEDFMKQLSNITALFPPMNPQTLMRVLQSLNITVPSESDINDVLKFLANALPSYSKQENNGTEGGFLQSSQMLYSHVTPGCKAALGYIGSQLIAGKPWAIQMIDSWGKPRAAILDGATHWFGSYDECLAVNPEQDGKVPFEPNICGALIETPIPGPMGAVSITVGACLPNVCSNADVYLLFKSISELIPGDALKLQYAACQEKPEFDNRAIIAICVCGFFLGLMIFATFFDACIVGPELKRIADVIKAQEIDTTATEENGGSPANIDVGLPVKHDGNIQTNGGHSEMKYKLHHNTAPTVHQGASQYPGLCAKLILSFSVWTNGRKLLSTEQSGGTLGSINGIRFLSMTWVVLGHTYVFPLLFQSIDNTLPFATKMLNRKSFMAITNALLSVDTFFALSGLLVAYVLLKEMKREKGRINWFMFYFHRFWRLTPPYMLIMMMDIALYRYVGDGPTWTPNGFETDFCEDTWWTNLLYINNVYKSDKMCIAWSWYLANDMQFYIVSPIMLVPLYFSKKIGGVITALFLLAVTIASGVVSAHYNLPSTQYSLVPNPNAGLYFGKYYIKPYCRMGPYIVGIITGYILYRTRGQYKIKLPINLLIWTVMIALGCLVMYGTYQEQIGHPMGSGVANLYNAVHKTIWGVCVCWVIFACVTGNGGFVNTILSWGAFIPLGRLTYCTYLVHPLVIFAYIKSLRQGMYATDISMIFLFLGTLVVSYSVAFVLSLAFESPMMGLERAVFRKDRKKNK